MTEDNIKSKTKKKKLKISNINQLKNILKEEGYTGFDLEKENLKRYIEETFNVDKSVTDTIYKLLLKEDITYRANNITDFIEYMENIMLFQKKYNKLRKNITNINKLNISRIEYEREISIQEDVEHMIKEIEHIKKTVSKKITDKEIYRLEKIEKQLDKDYIYSKDIELLKKIVSTGSGNKTEVYDEINKVKTISIDINDDINCTYIPAQPGSIEYHLHIKNNIPRMRRLLNNMNKYMVPKEDYKTFSINQSKTLQDTINIAVATYNNKEFKAISGSNEVSEFCKSPIRKNTKFRSSKVNKLGKLGTGYNRVNDSEKKIFEEIHKQIESKKVNDFGELILYSKWEPCPSCYHVISQFCKIHPKVNVQVKYSKKYGE